MTKKDFFRIVLRILGLYFLAMVVFNYLPSIVVFFHSLPFLSLILAIVVVSLFAYIFLLLILKPDPVIRIFKLDKGFDDDALSAKRIEFVNLLKIAIIATGLFLIISHLPTFLTHLLFLLKLVVKNRNEITDHVESALLTDYISWGIKILSLIVGYLMITNYSAIARFIIKKDSEKQSDK